jgi:DNA polymerase III epsilon subunit-like protein
MRVVVLDFETYPVNGTSMIMEIGGVEWSPNGMGKTFHTLVRPAQPVSPFVLNLTGISETLLAVAPLFSDVMADFHAFLGDAIVVAHNASLDQLTYDATCDFYGVLPWVGTWIDSQDIIKILVPTSRTLQLQTLLIDYNIRETVSHRADDDAIGLAQLLTIIRDRYSWHCTPEDTLIFNQVSLNSVGHVRDFLMRYFQVEIRNNNRPFCGDTYVPSNDDCGGGATVHHLNDLPLDSVALGGVLPEPSVVVTDQSIWSDRSYIDACHAYASPGMVTSLHAILTDPASSHVEQIEVMGLVHWLGQTTTFYKNDLNNNLMTRYHHIVDRLVPKNAIQSARFLCYLCQTQQQNHAIIQCHESSFVQMMTHFPEFFSGLTVVFYNVSQRHQALYNAHRRGVSYTVCRPLLNSLRVLTWLNQPHLDPSDDNVTLMSWIQQTQQWMVMANKTTHRLFRQLRQFIVGMPLNGPKKHPVVWVTEDHQTTKQWAGILNTMQTIDAQLSKLCGIMSEFSVNHRARYSPGMRMVMAAMVALNQAIQSIINVKKPGAISILVMVRQSVVYPVQLCVDDVHDTVYDCTRRYAKGVIAHQPMHGFCPPDYLTDLMGGPVNQHPSEPTNVRIISKTMGAVWDWVGKVASDYTVYCLCHTKKQANQWRKKVTQRARYVSMPGMVWLTMNQYHKIPNTKNSCILFPRIYNDHLRPHPDQPMQVMSDHQFFYYSLCVQLSRLNPWDQCQIILNVTPGTTPGLAFDSV